MSIIIDEIKFKEFIIKEGVKGWNNWWKNTPGVIPPVCDTYEELTEAIKWSVDIDLEGADLSGLVLDEIILSYANCQNANFTNTSFNHAKLACVEFTGSKLVGVDFTGADLSFSMCINADMRDAIFNDTQLFGILLEGAKLDGCDLSKAIDHVSFDNVLIRLGIREIVVEKIVDNNKKAGVE